MQLMKFTQPLKLKQKGNTMDSQKPIGIFHAIFRWIFMWNWRKARGISDAADKLFTGSTEGISAAFDIHHDKTVTEFKSMRDAVAQVENVLEQQRGRLVDLNNREKGLLDRREGALASFEAAKKANDTTNMEAHQVAFDRYDGEIQDIEVKQGDLEKAVAQQEEAMKKYMLRLREMHAEIEKLPREKADAIAEFVSSNAILALNDRLMSLQTSFERGPLDAVRKANRELTAKARISERMAGTDSRLADQEYEAAGRQATSKERMDQMLAARASERAGKTGEKPPVVNKTDRPEIQ